MYCSDKNLIEMSFPGFWGKRLIEISETLLTGNDCMKIPNVFIITHALFRRNRIQKDKKKGGGVALFVAKTLAPRERPDLMMFDENVFIQFRLILKILFKKFRKNSYQPNVQSLKTTSREVFKHKVIQLRLRFRTTQHCTCTGWL